MLFPRTRQKAETILNDRVSQPIKMSVMISCAAFLMAGLALIIVVGKNANH